MREAVAAVQAALEGPVDPAELEVPLGRLEAALRARLAATL